MQIFCKIPAGGGDADFLQETPKKQQDIFWKEINLARLRRTQNKSPHPSGDLRLTDFKWSLGGEEGVRGGEAQPENDRKEILTDGGQGEHHRKEGSQMKTAHPANCRCGGGSAPEKEFPAKQEGP